MLPEAIFSSIVVGLIRKGKLTNFKDIHIKGWYFILISALIQILGIKLSQINNNNINNFINSYYIYIHIMSYIFLFAGLGLNLEKKSFKLLFTGAALNYIVILANGGQMPVHVPFGPIPKVDIWHTILTQNTRLMFLADVIPVPKPYPFPKILSIGDLLIIAGVFIFIQNCMLKPFSKNNYIH